VVYTISYMAGHGLTNALTLHHATNPKREFPLVMIMGSVGWIAAGWTVSQLDLEKSADMFGLASTAALVMGIYSFTLPHTPPKGTGAGISFRTMLGIDALQLLRERSFAAFILCSFLICIPLSFYFNWMNVFMNELQINDAAAKMTLGQVSDVVFLLLLPVFLSRVGVKGILLLGMTAWTLRFGMLSWFDTQQNSLWMLFLAIGIHGICYDFIFVMGRMYVDDRARPEIRGAAQGLHAIMTLGLGMFIGSWLAGVVGEYYANPFGREAGTHGWREIWLLPAGLSAVLLIVFALLFTDQPPQNREVAD
jgi:nucleoside transporter